MSGVRLNKITVTAKIFLIRHAQTHLSKERKYCGRLNPSLTKDGLEAARSLSGYFKAQTIDFIYSSPAKRSIETARAIFNGRRFVASTDALKEIDFGLWEGLVYEDLIKKYPLLYPDWVEDPYRVNIPEGESLIAAEKRVRDFFRSMLNDHKNNNVAVISHFGPIRLILSYILGEDKQNFWKREIGLCSVNILEYDGLKFIAHTNRRVL